MPCGFDRIVRPDAFYRDAARTPMLAPMTHPPLPPPFVLRRIRTRLAARIEKQGIPLARLARRAGVSTNTVRNAIDDDTPRDIHVGTLWALCVVLELRLGELFEPLPDEGEDPPA